MRWLAKILSNGLQGTCPCLLLSLERKSCMGSGEGRVYRRYLLNAGGNTQRLCMEHRVKTQQFYGVFLSRGSAEYCGGLGGIHFSMADSGSSTLEIRGPQRVQRMITNYKHFVRRKYPNLRMVHMQSSCSQFAKYEDSTLLQTLAVTLRKSDKKIQSKRFCHWCALDEDTDDDEDEDDDEEEESESSDESSSEDEESGDELEPEDVALCYVFRVFGHVHQDGRHVKEHSPSVVIAVVDCPSEEHVTSLTQSTHLGCKGCVHNPSMIFHLAHKRVVECEEYVRWCESFGETETTHVFVHHSVGQGSKQDLFRSSARWTTKLSVAAPSLFQVDFRTGWNPALKSLVLTKYYLFAGKDDRVDQSGCVKDIDLDTCEAEAKLLTGMQDPNAIDIDDDVVESDVVRNGRKRRRSSSSSLTFLGTGAAKPSRLRGCSSILVETSADDCFLLDVGEGTYSQLVRYAGELGANQIVNRLEGIWVSHHHYDHHGGLLRILEVREKLRNRSRLQIWGPASLGVVLKEYFRGPPFYKFSHCREASSFKYPSILRFTSVPVHHCFDAHALAIDIAVPNERETNRKVRLIYSGDTRPCSRLVQAFKKQTDTNHCVLIHEATFDDSLLEQAKRKRHSTINEALDVGKRIGADVTLLTHFSQRYPNIAQNEGEYKQQAAGKFMLASDFFRYDLTSPEKSLSQNKSMMKVLTASSRDIGTNVTTET